MARSMWRGAIQFGLVTIPVKLYLATETNAGLSFNLLHKTCLTRVQMRTWCPYHEEYINRADTVRGFEYAKGPVRGHRRRRPRERAPQDGALDRDRALRRPPARRAATAALREVRPTTWSPRPIGRKAFYLLKSVLR